MSDERLEIFLARLYTDAAFRADFLANPRDIAAAAGLSPADCDGLCAIDRDGLELAARSYEHKRRGRAELPAGTPAKQSPSGWLRATLQWMFRRTASEG